MNAWRVELGTIDIENGFRGGDPDRGEQKREIAYLPHLAAEVYFPLIQRMPSKSFESYDRQASVLDKLRIANAAGTDSMLLDSAEFDFFKRALAENIHMLVGSPNMAARLKAIRELKPVLVEEAKSAP